MGGPPFDRWPWGIETGKQSSPRPSLFPRATKLVYKGDFREEGRKVTDTQNETMQKTGSCVRYGICRKVCTHRLKLVQLISLTCSSA